VLVSLCLDVMYGNQPFAVAENLAVDSQHRGKGLGEKLLREVERFCLREDCSKIMLMSSATRVDAHRFFERMGFRSDYPRALIFRLRILVAQGGATRRFSGDGFSPQQREGPVVIDSLCELFALKRSLEKIKGFSRA
jgi:hypothetical protein